MSRKNSKTRKKLKQTVIFNKKKLKNSILSVLYDKPDKEVNYKQISSWLGVKDDEGRRLVNVALQEMKDDEYLEQVSRGSFRLKARTGTISGTVELQQQGFAYVNSEEVDRPVLVSSRNLNHAMDGDKVRVFLYARRKKHDLEGEVTEILERAKTHFVGTVELSQNFAFLLPAGKVGFDIFIAKENLNGAKNGQKAIAEIIEWPAKARSPFGKITEVLGDTGNNDAEMHAILAEFELPHKFPVKVDKLAEKIPFEIPEAEYLKRRDFREITTFTIDPADAKDFDDALSIRKLESGNWEIGIHIADVTHYVTPASMIEEEAQSRATSVYLVDRVVPMLPERLSNGVCSLRPNEDKLCFSAVFEMNEDAHVKKEWFGKTVIHSNHRFSYEEAQEIIEKQEGIYSSELLKLNELALKLRDERFKKGSIGFERVEIKFNIDENGKPLSVFFKESKDANKLIEEFMLLANKKVAEFIGKPPTEKIPKRLFTVFMINPIPINWKHLIHLYTASDMESNLLPLMPFPAQ
jgi:ribonuclease R